MTDDRPVPNDAFGSLFEYAFWLYPRVWAGFALLFAATMAPGQLASIAAGGALGLSSPAELGAAVQSGAVGRIGLLLAIKVAFFGVLLFNHWACLAMADAVARGEEPSVGAALGAALRRLPAQAWTFLGFFFRLIPIALMAGIAAGLTVRDSPATAVLVLILGGIPYAYFTLRWALSSVVTQLEGVSGGDALRRSSALCGGRFWLFSFQFVVYNAAALAPAFILGFAARRFLPAWAASVPGIVFAGLVLSPFSKGMILALYRREAARAAAREPAPAA